MKISVIVPTRMQKNPVARPEAGDLYLDRSLMSVVRNTRDAGHELEILVGLDAGARQLPKRFIKCLAEHPEDSEVKCGLDACHHGSHLAGDGDEWPVAAWRPYAFIAAYAEGKGQAQAVNAAAKRITGDLVAMVEDDDCWRPDKIAIQLAVMEKGYDFVSTTQREIAEDGSWLRTNAFACPSTWLMTREVWEKVGPFDETFRWHVDTEWLGRLNAAGIKRAHITHAGSDQDGCWVDRVAKYSDLVSIDEAPEPLVDRTENTGGGMTAIRADGIKIRDAFMAAHSPDSFASQDDAVAAFQKWSLTQDGPAGESAREHLRMLERFGVVPW